MKENQKLLKMFMDNHIAILKDYSEIMLSKCMVCPHRDSHISLAKECGYKGKCFIKRRRATISRALNIVSLIDQSLSKK